MKSFTVGTLPLISNSQAVPGFILQTPITGLDSPEIRMNTYSRPGQDGSIVSSMFYDVRTVSLTGIIWANNPTDFETYRMALASACAIQKDSFGYPVPTRVYFTTLANNSYYFDAYIQRPVFDYKDVNFSNFLVNMTVANPYIFGASQVVSSTIAPATGGGFILPVVLPITSSASSGGSVTVTNTGNVATYPIITLTGPLTQPYLYNSTIGSYMQLNYTINSGDIITIDMLNKTIVLNGSSSLLSTKTATSNWWALRPGANNISISTTSSSDTGSAVATFNPAYLGA